MFVVIAQLSAKDGANQLRKIKRIRHAEVIIKKYKLKEHMFPNP
jgi:hypothetical protein